MLCRYVANALGVHLCALESNRRLCFLVIMKNLVATGQVETTPDEGILGMIYDLPEGLALSSLQKFATIDKSSMRSRIAYLAGVLRRELEKINRR